MGRGTGQEALLEDRFADVMGNRRGSAKGQELRDEAELLDARGRLIGMLAPQSDQATAEGRLQFMYDFLALYKLGATPGSEFYQQLLDNVAKSIVGIGSGTGKTDIVRRARLQEVLVWLAHNKKSISEGPLQPVVDALTQMTSDGSIAATDLAKIPDVLCADGDSCPALLPLFQSLSENRACDARMWEVVDGLVPSMLRTIREANTKSLGEELRPFVVLVGMRLSEHVSSPVEYDHVGQFLIQADDDERHLLTPMIEGVEAHRKWLMAEAKASKAERRRARFEKLKAPLRLDSWVSE